MEASITVAAVTRLQASWPLELGPEVLCSSVCLVDASASAAAATAAFDLAVVSGLFYNATDSVPHRDSDAAMAHPTRPVCSLSPSLSCPGCRHIFFLFIHIGTLINEGIAHISSTGGVH